MNKVVRRKLIGASFCIIVAIALFAYRVININNMSEELLAYTSGFIGGILGVGIYALFLAINAIVNPKKGKELENEVKDERLKAIHQSALAMTARIAITTQAIISLVCAFTNNMDVAKYVGFGICAELIVYLISYFIEKIKN